MRNQKKYVLGLVISIIALAVGVSYAYFTATFQNLGIRETSITLAELGSLKLTAESATYTSGGQYPGDMAIQKFVVEPVSKGTGIYELDLTGVIDESIFGSDVEIQLYKSLDNTEVTITEGELTKVGDNYSRIDTLVTNGLTPIYTGTLKNGLNRLYQEDFEVINESGLKIRENSSSASYSKYTFFLVYNYKNNGNQNTQMGKTFTGTISAKLIMEKDITADNTLESLQTLNSNLAVTLNTGSNPDFAKFAPKLNAGEEHEASIDSEYYITYASSYSYDVTTGVYTLENYTTCQLNDCYSDLTDKYFIPKANHEYGSDVDTPFYESISETGHAIAKISSIDALDMDSWIYEFYLYVTEYTGSELYEYDNGTWLGQPSGLYELEDDYGTSYYFRGDIDYNYVKFGTWQTDYYNGYVSSNNNNEGFTSLSACEAAAGSGNCTKYATAGDDMYWRIIRINGDGSIRMIYDGTSAYSNQDMEYDGVIRSIGKSVYNTSGYNAGLGYMYGDISTSTSYAEEHANINDSDIKTRLDNWYQSQMTNYSNYISDTLFCNDRSLASNDIASGYANNGYGANSTLYGAYGRFKEQFDLSSGNKSTLICPRQHDAFTVDDTIHGNGDLTYPVGMITYDEANIAGAVKFSEIENTHYLVVGTDYLTMSAYGHMGVDGTAVFGVSSSGDIETLYIDANNSIRPVINIKYDAINAGDGTANNPFRIE